MSTHSRLSHSLICSSGARFMLANAAFVFEAQQYMSCSKRARNVPRSCAAQRMHEVIEHAICVGAPEAAKACLAESADSTWSSTVAAAHSQACTFGRSATSRSLNTMISSRPDTTSCACSCHLMAACHNSCSMVPASFSVFLPRHSTHMIMHAAALVGRHSAADNSGAIRQLWIAADNRGAICQL